MRDLTELLFIYFYSYCQTINKILGSKPISIGVWLSLNINTHVFLNRKYSCKLPFFYISKKGQVAQDRMYVSLLIDSFASSLPESLTFWGRSRSVAIEVAVTKIPHP